MAVEAANVTNINKMQANATTESDLQKTSLPTIYPNEFDFSTISGMGFNSTTSRSFVRTTKPLGQEHRNISVPNSLKVPNTYYRYASTF